jgi:hypothetical protein
MAPPKGNRQVSAAKSTGEKGEARFLLSLLRAEMPPASGFSFHKQAILKV